MAVGGFRIGTVTQEPHRYGKYDGGDARDDEIRRFSNGGGRLRVIREASWVVQNVTGANAYVYGVDNGNEEFREELRAMVEYVKRAAQEEQR
jgi:hypothetical protein